MSNEQTQVGGASNQSQTATRPPLPPFTRETAIQKVRLAEDGWNSRGPERWPWLTPSIRAGETGLSFRMDDKRLSNF